MKGRAGAYLLILQEQLSLQTEELHFEAQQYVRSLSTDSVGVLGSGPMPLTKAICTDVEAPGVIPAKAGIQSFQALLGPAFAGVPV